VALLAEEVVEEWLNRQGFFTIRGIKLGVAEMDILAIRHRADGVAECRHYEVQASVNPVGYISRVPRAEQKRGVAANSAKQRGEEHLRVGVAEWVAKKFADPRKPALREGRHRGPWSWHFVIGEAKHADELAIFCEYPHIEILRLAEIMAELLAPSANAQFPIASASGKDLADLIALGGWLPFSRKGA